MEYYLRAKQSFTASGMYSSSGPSTPTLPIYSVLPGSKNGIARPPFTSRVASAAARSCGGSQPCPAAAAGEGLLNDARNLMGALGLYCDLLAMPGVLKPEHNHYPEELRLLGNRSSALIENLMKSVLAQGRTDGLCMAAKANQAAGIDSSAQIEASKHDLAGDIRTVVKPVSLRSIIERCSGLLSQVAGGRRIEVDYGVAAAVPVRVSEEAVERILVNLVRNAASALGDAGEAIDANSGPVQEGGTDGAEGEAIGAIRIRVGSLANRVGDPKPWPFRRVRLTVEDSGCGMEAEQLERLLCAGRAPSRGSHGIGFRVVRELVGASGGDLRVRSQPGVGTRVQIEWPMAALATMDLASSDLSDGGKSVDRTMRHGDVSTGLERLGTC